MIAEYGGNKIRVPTYQIQKIIRVYIKQLIQSESAVSHNALGEKFFLDRIKINIKGKCSVIIDKITTDLLDRKTNLRSNDELDRESQDRVEKKIHKKSDFNKVKNPEFVFYMVNAENEKIRSRIPVNDTRFLLEKLESLVKKAVDGNRNT